MTFDFCLPIYNEEKIIADSIRQLSNYLTHKKFPIDWRIVIINNGSTDDSENICKFFLSDKIIFKNIFEKGRGRALRLYWQESTADIVCYMDSDLAVALDDIEKLVNEFVYNNADIVIGSRLLPESKIERSMIREAISRGCNLAYKLIIGHHVSDTQCGFKAIKAEKFKIISRRITDHQWFFDTELITYALEADYKLAEIPVTWEEARYDQRKSKVKIFRDSWLHFTNLLDLRRKL